MVLANQNAKLTGPDQGFLVPRLALYESPGNEVDKLLDRRKDPFEDLDVSRSKDCGIPLTCLKSSSLGF
jgi:hypothetical protein